MARAVANRPPENFEISVQMPEWAITEPDEETWFEAPDNGVLVNPDGSGPADPALPPLPPSGEDEPSPAPQDRLDQDFIDRATDRDRPEPPRLRERDRDRREPGRRRDPDLAPPTDRRSERSADPVE